MSVAAKVSPEIETPRPQKTWFAAAVGLLILILVLELIVPARRQSSSFDEGMHTFAGYSYWARGDFGLNPEHPPLVKLLAALPLLRDHVTYPNLPPIFFKFSCAVGASQFLYANHNADSMLFRARMAAATRTIAAALVVFAAAYEMFGATVGLLALVLFVFEPNLIAHGSFVTTDMGASLFLFVAVYAFTGIKRSLQCLGFCLWACWPDLRWRQSIREYCGSQSSSCSRWWRLRALIDLRNYAREADSSACFGWRGHSLS